MTAARKLAEAWERYRASFTDPKYYGTREEREESIADSGKAFDECTRLAHQILQEETDDKE